MIMRIQEEWTTSKKEKEEVPEPKIKVRPCARAILTFVGDSSFPFDLKKIKDFLRETESDCKTSSRALKKLCEAGLLKKEIQPKRLEGGVRKPERGVYIITAKGREVISKKQQ